MGKRLSSEEIFYNDIKTLINNLFIDNPNYKNHYYFKDSDTKNTLRLIKDTKDRAKYIIDRMEQTKHLIDNTFID